MSSLHQLSVIKIRSRSISLAVQLNSSILPATLCAFVYSIFRSRRPPSVAVAVALCLPPRRPPLPGSSCCSSLPSSLSFLPSPTRSALLFLRLLPSLPVLGPSCCSSRRWPAEVAGRPLWLAPPSSPSSPCHPSLLFSWGLFLSL